MNRIPPALLLLILIAAAGCDPVRITADAPPPSCGDGPTMGSTC